MRNDQLWKKHCFSSSTDGTSTFRQSVFTQKQRKFAEKMKNVEAANRFERLMGGLTKGGLTLDIPEIRNKHGTLSVKLLVVGEGAVGKTSTIVSYSTNIFPEDYIMPCPDYVNFLSHRLLDSCYLIIFELTKFV